MPTNQPSNAPDSAPEPHDEASVAAAVTDEQMDDAPGGGGLGGLAAADDRAGATRDAGGHTRGTPIDLGIDTGDANAASEARVLATPTDADAAGTDR